MGTLADGSFQALLMYILWFKNISFESKVLRDFWIATVWFGILLPKSFWPTVRKNCFSDQESILKFEAEGLEFAKDLRSVEQFIQTVKVS